MTIVSTIQLKSWEREKTGLARMERANPVSFCSAL